MEKDGSDGDGAGASVIHLIQPVWEPGTAGHTRKHFIKGFRCVGEPCSMVAGLSFQRKKWDICLQCGYGVSKRVNYCTELSGLHRDDFQVTELTPADGTMPRHGPKCPHLNCWSNSWCCFDIQDLANSWVRDLAQEAGWMRLSPLDLKRPKQYGRG